MLYNKAAHIDDELYNTFKTWAPEQCTKFFNTSGCVLEFVIWHSLFKEQPRRRSPCQQPSENIQTYCPRKPSWNYHPSDAMITPSNSRTCSYLNEPRLIHRTSLNIKPARSSSKNTSRQERFPLQNPLKLHHSSLSKTKKLGNYAPVKTTSISIAIPSRMPISSPSSPTLLTNYEDCWSLPNLTCDGGITMSSSN